ncbi:putative muramoyltetrapeptide carboxypeptidase (LD-carboxypeptidase A) [Neisseria meningitidis]|nr:putative muramoyltetrapeptide carboxypeptidase (LD-carboxypeptidase A) [Neisseria meningitidis]
MTEPTSRRRFLKTCTAAAGAGLLQACGTAPASNNAPSAPSHPVAKARTVYPEPPHHSNSADNLLRIVASSGFAEDINRVNTALTRLYNAGFTVTTQQAGTAASNGLPVRTHNVPPISKMSLPVALPYRKF